MQDKVVLLVEDSSMALKMLRNMFKLLGFANLRLARDGNEAVAVLEKESVSMVVSDWNMPAMDGFELLTRVRSNAETEKVPFLMATAQGERKQAEKAMAAGADGWLTKPFRLDELRKEVHRILGSEEAGANDLSYKIMKTGTGAVWIRIAYIQTTDHVVLAALDHLVKAGELAPKSFRLEAHCMSGWNPVERALESGDVDGASIAVPVAMDLHASGVPVQAILLSQRGGGIGLRNKVWTEDLDVEIADFLRGKEVLIPHRLSVHHMLAHQYLSGLGLKPGVPESGADIDVTFEVIPPVKMAEFMAYNETAAAAVVSQPVGAMTVAADIGERLFYTNELWPGHPNCVIALRRELIQAHPEAVQEFADHFTWAGRWVMENPDKAAVAAAEFINPEKKLRLTSDMMLKALTGQGEVTSHNLFPDLEDLDKIQRYMAEEMGTGQVVNLEEFVELRFAEKAYEL